MSNEELTVLILDKLKWDYELCLNPDRYSSTQELLAGSVLLAVLDSNTIPVSAKSLGVGVQTLNRVISKIFIPKFGVLNGGGETWKYKFLSFIQYKVCSSCKKTLHFTAFDTDIHNTDGKHSYCKECRKPKNKINNALRSFKRDSNNRIPPWAIKEEIVRFYEECPEGYAVDHELPLCGKYVSGLHIETNLQYLTPAENSSKGNRIDLDAYNKKHFGT